MRTALYIFVFLLVGTCWCQENSCSFDGHDFDQLVGIHHYVSFGEDENGNSQGLWFTLCETLDSIQCDESSAVCVLTEGSEDGVNFGSYNGSLFSYTNDGKIELTFGPGQTCGNDGKVFKTILQMNCDPFNFLEVTDVQRPTDCDVVISANSTFACSDVLPPTPSISIQPESSFIHSFGIWILFVGLFLSIICLKMCFVCFYIKHTKESKRKAQEKEQELSQVHKLQPIPSEQNYDGQVPEPFFPQPYVCYIIPQQLETIPAEVEQEVPLLSREKQEEADEQFAKRLQEELNSFS